MVLTLGNANNVLKWLLRIAYLVSVDPRRIDDRSDLTRLISKTLGGIADHTDQMASIEPYAGLN